jgi:hypothetical protein
MADLLKTKKRGSQGSTPRELNTVRVCSALPLGHLGEVSGLSGPQGGGPQPKHQGGGDEGVEAGVELGSDVGGVAEHTHHQRPLHLQVYQDDEIRNHSGIL